jgi:superfamily II DNA or RNA helicase
MGMPARHLDSGTPIAERRSIISAFRNGQLKFLINYDILTTGFDAPNTDAVAILRTTDDCDQPLITQMVGRGLRGPRFGGTEECIVFIRGMR